MNAVIQYSGGAASFVAGYLIERELDIPFITWLFADVLTEDEDLYRFNNDVEKFLRKRLVRLCEGRTPWEVFFDERYIGNTRKDPCSKILKRKLIRKWVEENTDPNETVLIFGYDANEGHRVETTAERWAPWKVRAPLCEQGIFKEEVFDILEYDCGLLRPRLYDLGFAHNNCGGACVKAGQGAWVQLLEKFPELYAEHEQKEAEFRKKYEKDVAILRDRRGGTTKPLTLEQLRLRNQEHPEEVDRLEIGGCGCMEGEDD